MAYEHASLSSFGGCLCLIPKTGSVEHWFKVGIACGQTDVFSDDKGGIVSALLMPTHESQFLLMFCDYGIIRSHRESAIGLKSAFGLAICIYRSRWIT